MRGGQEEGQEDSVSEYCVIMMAQKPIHAIEHRLQTHLCGELRPCECELVELEDLGCGVC